MMKNGKIVKTECVEARMKKDFKTSVHVDVKGLDCFEDYQEISTTLNASGVVIVHSCEEVFVSSENIERIETYTDDISKREYTRIIFKKKVE